MSGDEVCKCPNCATKFKYVDFCGTQVGIIIDDSLPPNCVGIKTSDGKLAVRRIDNKKETAEVIELRPAKTGPEKSCG